MILDQIEGLKTLPSTMIMESHTLKMLEIDNLFISGIILSLKECSEKGKEKALRNEGFGQIEFYAISRYEESILVIWIFVNIADYDCVNLQMTTKAYIV